MPEEISQEIKDLIIARLEESSSDRLTFFGNGEQKFTKEDLIEEVEKNSDLGKKIIELELNYLRALAGGELLREIIST